LEGGSKSGQQRFPSMTDRTSHARPKNRETENENLRNGSPPKPATGSTGSNSGKTLTDPATGAPNR